MKVMIIGATSALAHETAKHFAKDGGELFLVARNEEKLAAVAGDLKVRGAHRVETYLLDVTDIEQQPACLKAAVESLDWLDMLLIAHGTLGDQRKCELSVEETLRELTINATSVIAFLTLAANYFEPRNKGCIAVISSVAGDRGRKSNYVYGTAKAAVSTFLQGLRNRLGKTGVSVVTIKPGIVETPMTANLRKGLLTARAPKVGEGIYQAMKHGQDIVYLPWFWRPIMLIIGSIPERIYKKLSIG